MRKITLISCLFFAVVSCFAQRGKNGNLTVTTAMSVNEYTTLTADAIAGSTSITVANSGLNAKARFAGNLAVGDLVMIVQMQGATINGIPLYWWLGSINVAQPNDSSWGAVTAYNNCGNYEFAEVSAVPNATTIQFDCGLTNNYTSAGIVQVVRVPRYNTLTINSGGSITCDTWDSAVGGIIAVEVLGNTVINSGGNINATGDGFRGARLDSNGATYGVNNSATNGKLYIYGKAKGEGIAGYEWMLDQFGGRNCRGAAANSGGGGNAHNSGGGGGSNGGIIANWIDGIGDPDVSTANNIKAWNLEYSWLSGVSTRTGGGRGGYSFSANKLDPTVDGPNNNVWAGDNRSSQGGLGGRPLDYSTGKIFMAGGGGAGDQDNNFGGTGGNGGGIVYLVSYGTVTGAGQILANGAVGGNAAGTAPNTGYAGQDGAGGAGGGGTVIINSTGNISGVSIQANGGTGGNQAITKGALYVGNVNESEGPGGGGGGGYIATSNVGVTESATGGANGTTNSTVFTKFPPNGATKGGTGTSGASITNFQIVAKNDTICSGQSATLTATLTGTVPGGTTINWFSTITGGVPLSSGSPYVTVALTKDTVFYVGTCSGTYRQAVNVIIGSSASTTISAPATICAGGTTNLSASGGTAYSWLPAGSLNNAAIANPVASPTVTTTYTVTITTPCGTSKDSVKITVTPGPTITATAALPTICSGSSTTINASGGTTYTWSPAIGLSATTGSPVTASPNTTEVYTVTGTTAGCSGTQTVTLTVNTTPTVTASAVSPTICAGTSTALNASGATTYSWTPNTALSATTGASITASPTSNIIYTVTGTSVGCTSAPQTVAVTVNAKPVVAVTPPSPGICSGGNVALVASGASTYAWTPVTGLSVTSGTNVTASPASTTTYAVIGTSAAGCTDTTNVTVTVGSSLVAAITGKDTVCAGGSTTLTASGGSSYVWNTGATNAALTISPASTTPYTVTVSSGACNATATVTVTVNPGLNPTITGVSSICKGSGTTLTANGGGTYLWNTGSTTSSINVSPTTTTAYTVQVSKGGCVKDTNLSVTVNNIPTVTITNSSTICAGSNVVLTATGGGTYSWTGGVVSTSSSVSVSPINTTTYSLSVSNGSCSKDTTTTITVNPAPSVTISGNNSICTGASTTLTATGGGTYSWTGGVTSSSSSITVTPASNTTYSLQVSNGTCTTTDSVIVTVNVKPNPTITGSQTICQGTSVALIATGGATYSWTPVAGLSSVTSNNVTANPAVTTEYVVTVANGSCTASDSVKVTVDPAPTGAACCNTTVVSGESTNLTISASSVGEAYSWTPATGLSCTNCFNPVATPTTTTKYYVTITDSAGCTKIDSVLITVRENCGQIFIPKAFSPNGDGENDVLYVRGDCIQSMDFTVFDRWGNKIFESTNPSDGWDGKYNGQPMETGTYVYYLHALDIYNNSVVMKGNVTLVK